MSRLGEAYELHQRLKEELVWKRPEEARAIIAEYRKKFDWLLNPNKPKPRDSLTKR